MGDTSTRTSCERKRKQKLSLFKDLKSLEANYLSEQERLCKGFPSTIQPDLGVLPFMLSWPIVLF